MSKELAIQKSKELKKELQQKIEDMAIQFKNNPEDLVEYLKFSERFAYQYSAKNMQLIFSQNRGAVFCQSLKAWKEQGYPVKENQQGMKIFVPVKATYLQTDKGEVRLIEATPEQKKLFKEGKLKSRTALHFGVGTTFDVAQTEFPVENYPKILTAGYDSEKHRGYLENLIQYAKEHLGVEIYSGENEKQIQGVALRGYLQGKDIHVNSILKDSEALSTFTHELGHHILNHQMSQKITCQKEFEADAFSILLLTHLGIEIEATRKAHLSEHYTQLIEKEKGKKCATKSFDEVYSAYRKFLKEIEPYLTKSLSSKPVFPQLR